MHKSDLGCSVAELTLGVKLRLPAGLFLEEISDEDFFADHTSYRRNLETFLSSLKTSISRDYNTRKEYVDKLLLTCSHVFIRQDACRHPLQMAYTGPYQVLQRAPKYFTILLGRKIDRVSIDRLKPARLLICSGDEADSSSPVALTPELDDDGDLSVFLEQGVDLQDGTASSLEKESSCISQQAQRTNIVRTRLGRKIVKPVRFRKSL